MPKKTTVLKQYVSHLAEFRWTALLLCLTIASGEAVGVLVYWLYKRWFDGLALAQQSAERASSFPELGSMLALAIGVHAFAWALWRVSGFLATHIQPRVLARLHETAFKNLLGQSPRFFSDTFAGSLVRQVRDFSGGFGVILESFLWRILPMGVSLTGILFVLSRQAPTLSILIFAWFIFFLTVNIIFFRWKRTYDLERAKKDSLVVAQLSDALANALNIKLFNSSTEEGKRHALALEERRKIRTFQWRLTELNNLFQISLGVVIEIALMWTAFHYWKQGVLSLGDVILCQAYLFTMFQKTWDLSNTIKNIYESIADAQEMVDTLNTQPEIRDERGAKPLTVKKGAIEFDRVRFTYKDSQPVLSDFTLSIGPKEKIALVGPSGAGKSTIIKLLLRFYDVDDGNILIDGQNIAKVLQGSLRDRIALVPQDPFLFHRTLTENIRYGKRDATDEEVIEAAKKAHCHEFILHTPKGYDTLVGERGIKLSGGERQRIAIARAILKDAPILILDEATSSLDSESESLIQDALRELMKNKTAIAIAHRLSTIMQMDRIVVMEEGKVVDAGTHATLLKQDGIYQKLWEIQAGGFLP